MKISKTQTVVEIDGTDVLDIIKAHIKKELPGKIENDDITISFEGELPDVSVVVTHDLSKIPTIRTRELEQQKRAFNNPPAKPQTYNDQGEPITEYIDNLNVDDVFASKLRAAGS